MIDDDVPAEPRTLEGLKGLAGNLFREDLDPFSVEDLTARIEALEAEIGRTRQALTAKKSQRSAADALFSFKG
ncbi:DUF1192 domain-containing protein [Asticcacaulis machinosus]|uniref:DUF1192 domain-containing protein n=1 Tax=Asticcacaulis machinosus TaxID=2984211 RepID=A0ABT5HMV9_9CAUL|nr:DUF1192 domain-containing protein [Asticcacaulis machinosus]MDC7677583.1 DUF1192 domain-containing protein [Asticcacaulis machinosus]